MRAVRNGSSDGHSKLRPASGWRWMFMVGASSTRACFERASRPMAAPTSRTSSGSQVAPRAVPQGKQADVVPTKFEPRAPLGPSVTLMRGMPTRGTGVVCQASEPAASEIFSSSVIRARRASTRCCWAAGSGIGGLSWNGCPGSPGQSRSANLPLFAIFHGYHAAYPAAMTSPVVRFTNARNELGLEDVRRGTERRTHVWSPLGLCGQAADFGKALDC